ncbi:MAG: site-2 protease family protein [Anaerolineales bacterium]|nr:site-2 protease family protein [Anaerolineales bacterium]
MTSLPDLNIVNAIVGRVLLYEDVTLGDSNAQFVVRYRGRLLVDSLEAHTSLMTALQPYGLVPLFRKGNAGQAIVFLVPSLPKRKGTTPISLNLVMFLLTLFSVMFAGIVLPEGTILPSDLFGQLRLLLANLLTGWPFAVALLSILLAHEFGHYLMGRARKVDVSLPFFIPLPFSILGTLGAFINMRDIPRNKRDLFDIGIAGPLAGLIIAIPVLFIGLRLSHLDTIAPPGSGMGSYLEGNSLLYLFAKYLVFGRLLPEPVSYHGLPPLLYWVVYFFTGWPAPYGGTDVFLHPVALAGWAGILVTALNLIPAGQLDGGHILYALFGERLRKALPFIVSGLIVLGFFWSGWWLWAFLLVIFGRIHAEPLDQITELDPRRRILAWVMMVIFLLTFSPAPMIVLP